MLVSVGGTTVATHEAALQLMKDRHDAGEGFEVEYYFADVSL